MTGECEKLYEKKRRRPDVFLRCCVTLDCKSHCEYCSWDISSVPTEMRTVRISAETWVEGINRRGKPVIFVGAEPLLYEELPLLVSLIDSQIPLHIYTNLQHDIDELLQKANRLLLFSVSLHPNTPDFGQWDSRVKALLEKGHSVSSFNVIKCGDWVQLRDFLVARGYGKKIVIADDQRRLPMSRGESFNQSYPSVRCTQRMYLYGPDGYRYICIRLMGLGDESGRFEHISEPVGPARLEVVDCGLFGLCTPCSNLVEGSVYKIQ